MSDAGEEKRGRIVGGSILILIGGLFLLDNLDLFEFSWPMILIGIGAVLLIQSVLDKHHQPVQGGVLLLLLGLVFLADQERWLPWGMSRDWPLILFAVGISSIVGYWANPKKRGSLTGGIILLAIGAIFLATEYHYFEWKVVGDIFEWWPLILLGLGVWLLVKDRRPKPPDPLP
ncbi:hypothetical protein KQI63_16695 [bacterium]|nr:hypothetical protein [bacterium]